MNPAYDPTTAARAPRHALPARPVRMLLAALAVLALVSAFTAGAARADTAPQQWEPSAADLVRTLRPCPMQVSAPTPPVCWSMTEDTTAWTAQPAGSPYGWGQCTYYVGLMRPDIWNDRAPASADSLSDDWDAWTWVEHAQAEGLSVDGNPQAGDVMVYSRAAVNNSTGHVTIVDSVGGTDPQTGDLMVTVSEMNVDGLDDASQGQGDTMTLLLPRSELVPGMIQFIHKPGAGYTPPAWPAGSGGSTSPAPSASASSSGNPSLAFSLDNDEVETVSQSPAPVQAVVTASPGGTVVKRMSFSANQGVSLGLPRGNYQVCVSQDASGSWAAASACLTAAWGGPAPTAAPTAKAASTAKASTVAVHVDQLRMAAQRLTFSLVTGPGAARAVASSASAATAHAASMPRYTAHVTIAVRRAARVHGRRVMRTRVIYRATLHLTPGQQALSLPRAVRVLSRRSVLHVSVTIGGGHGVVGSSAHLLAHA